MKYFVVSDVHSYYKELRKALKEQGYDPENKDHFFISCGDLFDRGPDAQKCLDFVMSLPKDRRIFVKGNHEENLEMILRNHHITETDIYNKTADTVRQFAKCKKNETYTIGIDTCLRKRKLKAYLSECKDYYETDDYIFCHGFIPLFDETEEGKLYYRTADAHAWFWARWANGFKEWMFYKDMLPDKTIVFGHYHASYGHSHLHNYKEEYPRTKKNLDDCCFEPFYDKGIIGIDACTALTHKVNCIVLKD